MLVVVLAVVGFGQFDQASSASQISGQVDAVAGEPLCWQHCAVCHGEDLRGTPIGPSHLSIVYEPDHHPASSFALAIRNGVCQHHWNFGDMQPVPGLDDDEIAAVTAYVREQQQIHGFEPYPPPP